MLKLKQAETYTWLKELIVSWRESQLFNFIAELLRDLIDDLKDSWWIPN
jgi:hypothetical protein